MDGTGPMRHALVLLMLLLLLFRYFRGVACRHLLVGMDEQDLGRISPHQMVMTMLVRGSLRDWARHGHRVSPYPHSGAYG